MNSSVCGACRHVTYLKAVGAMLTLIGLALVTTATTAAQTMVSDAQTIPTGTFKHIIIVIQENRTPDNLFGALASGPCQAPRRFPGADIANGGSSVKDGKLCNMSQPMNNGSSFDPGHFYHDWYGDYDTGHMDGFCHHYNVQTRQIT